MEQYIPKSIVLAEIEKLYNGEIDTYTRNILDRLKSNIDTLEVKEVEETEQRMKECPFRQDICNRYKGTQVKCDGRCSWVVDYPKLKELKAQKGE